MSSQNPFSIGFGSIEPRYQPTIASIAKESGAAIVNVFGVGVLGPLKLAHRLPLVEIIHDLKRQTVNVQQFTSSQK
ncbi:MAG: hypothetical protein ACI92E_000171 [Oceanicoccus sp.]|jgi:hypothetical protein